MRNLKKILALVLALMMTLSLMVTANASSYTDADQVSDKYEEAVEVLSGMGIFQGTDKGVLLPKNTLTRREAAVLVYRLISGDVGDDNLNNYKGYAAKEFSDVPADAWYEPYVAYAVNGDYIQGDGKGHFNPDDDIKGTEVLAILLRAVGYDKNGEFSENWPMNVATLAKELGVTDTVGGVLLTKAVSREVVAELIFQTITKAYTVKYTLAFGYQPIYEPVTNSEGKTTYEYVTLGKKVFGLTPVTGIVVGNQATGEDATLVASKYTGYSSAAEYDFETGLDLFGHQVKVWYGKTGDYALFDKATLATLVEASDASLAGKLGEAAEAAGFDADTTAYWSNAYDQIVGTSATGAAFATSSITSPCGLYVLVSNNSGKAVDVVIRVNAGVRLVTDINNYIKKPTVTFSTIGSVVQKQVVNGLDNAVVGNYVIVNTVTGTDGNGAYYHLDTVTKTVSGKIISVATNGTVTLADGTKIEKSPLYATSDMRKDSLVAGVVLTFTLDNNGKYIGVAQPADEYLYVTYAYWEQTGISTITYYLQGVTLNGQITTVTTDKAGYDAAVKAKVAYKNYGGDQIADGTGYSLMKITDTAATATWSNTLKNVTLTASSDKLAANTFLSSSTVYHVITGYGDTLKVTPYTGVANLVGNATSVTVDGIYSVASLSTTTVTAYNYVVTNALIDGASFLYAGNYFYAGATAPAATAEKAGNSNIKQYELYVAGESTKTSVWVDTSSVTPVAHTFYTYTKTYDDTLDADVYTLVSAMGSDGENGRKNVTLTQASGNAQSYIARAASDGSVAKQIYAGDASVVDLTVVGAIDTVAKVNEAAETNDIIADYLLDSNGNAVAIYVTSVTEK